MLGTISGGRREVQEFVYYDDLDPSALNTGIVRFRGTAMSTLWDVCEQKRLEVVADVHTHPGAPWQSHADAAHPMISKLGHVGLIIPEFAQGGAKPSDLGIYEYWGNRQWRDLSGPGAENYFYIGWLG